MSWAVRLALPPRTQGMPREGPATLVAMSILSRRLRCWCNQRPMMFSVRLKVSALVGTE